MYLTRDYCPRETNLLFLFSPPVLPVSPRGNKKRNGTTTVRYTRLEQQKRGQKTECKKEGVISLERYVQGEIRKL